MHVELLPPGMGAGGRGGSTESQSLDHLGSPDIYIFLSDAHIILDSHVRTAYT